MSVSDRLGKVAADMFASVVDTEEKKRFLDVFIKELKQQSPCNMTLLCNQINKIQELGEKKKEGRHQAKRRIIAVEGQQSNQLQSLIQEQIPEILNSSGNDLQIIENHSFQTPRKGTPRKSYTPRKLHQDRDMTLILRTPSKHGSVVVPAAVTTTPSSEIPNIILGSTGSEVHIEPLAVVEQFISNPGILPEILADEINKIWNGFSSDSPQIQSLINGIMPDISSHETSASVTETITLHAAPEEAVPAIDKQNITDKLVNSILTDLESNPTISQFLDDFLLKCAEEEGETGTSQNDSEADYSGIEFVGESSPCDPSSSLYISTPHGSQTGSESTPRTKQSPRSLTTPKSIYREPAIATHSIVRSHIPIRNLMDELKTPEKRRETRTLHSSPFISSPSSSQHSPFQEPKTGHTPLKIVTPGFNTLIVSPVKALPVSKSSTVLPVSSSLTPLPSVATAVPPPILIGQPILPTGFMSCPVASFPSVAPFVTLGHPIRITNLTNVPTAPKTQFIPIRPKGRVPSKETAKKKGNQRIIVPREQLISAGLKRKFGPRSASLVQSLKEAKDEVKRTIHSNAFVEK